MSSESNPPAIKAKLINIEALRGFAALMVFLSHSLVYSEVIDKNFDFRENVFSYAPRGHLMVLVFFVLSGFVIGWTYKNNLEFSGTSFIKKRLIRLYPIYAVAIITTLFFFYESPRSIIATLIFGQNLIGPTFQQNAPLWSLNHEMIYYLLAIPVLKYRVNIPLIFVFILALLVVSGFVYPFYPILEAYLIGFLFWISGFSLAYHANKLDFSAGKLISVLFLLLACDYLNTFDVFLSKINFLHRQSRMDLDDIVRMRDLALYPFCLTAVAIAGGIWTPKTKVLSFIAFGAAVFHACYLIFSGGIFKTNSFHLPILFIFISLGFFFFSGRWKISLRFLAFFGSISYAFYVMHEPIRKLIGRVPYFNGTLVTFLVRTLLALTLCFFISFLLEKYYQPFFKKALVNLKSRLNLAKYFAVK